METWDVIHITAPGGEEIPFSALRNKIHDKKKKYHFNSVVNENENWTVMKKIVLAIQMSNGYLIVLHTYKV